MKQSSTGNLNSWIHSYLDGELDAAEAQAIERLMSTDNNLKRKVMTIQQLQEWTGATRPAAPPSMAARVVKAIEDDARRSREQTRRIPTKRSPTWFRPAWGWAAVAAVVAMVVIGQVFTNRPGTGEPTVAVRFGGGMHSHVGGPADVDRGVQVRHEFRCRAPQAGQVYLAGSFNEWRTGEIPLERTRGGIWRIVLSLEPGRYTYMFYVDGEWVTDPLAPNRIDDGFGNLNAEIHL
jgi:anti-sigma factor RsiW